MKLIFVRHGESTSNKVGRVTGIENAKLTQKGRRQAAATGRKLKRTQIDIIYSSPLIRALDTAKQIAKFHKGVKIVIKENLKERHHGVWEGKKIANIPEWGKRYELGFKPGGGESVEQIYARIKPFIKHILKRHKSQTVVIVAHGAVGRMVTIIALGKGPKHAIKLRTMSNAGINYFDIDKV